MTTLATDGRTLCSDSQATCGDLIVDTKAKKLFRLPDGRVAGIAGDMTRAEQLIRLYGTGEETPADLFDDVCLLIIDGTDRITVHLGSPSPTTIPAPFATGTGDTLALGAMLNGASPKEAVRIAITRDIYSGGRIQSMSVNQTRKGRTSV